MSVARVSPTWDARLSPHFESNVIAATGYDDLWLLSDAYGHTMHVHWL